ncbi:MAG: short-chain fatty acid transporter [Myxococcales bacterium]|nr:short-chain fatty acid transporter [Myxococcales bacterium]
MRLDRLALGLTRLTARWTPSAFAIACLLTLVTLVAGVTLGEASLPEVIRSWGDGFWALLRFGMQMCLIVFCGYMVAVAAPVRAALRWLARRPRSPRQAVVAMALVAMAIAWLHWGLGLIASAVMVGFVAAEQPRADYRLLVAVSYFGLGATWHAGPSGSVPLLLATPNNFLVKGGVFDQLIGIDRTIGMPFNIGFVTVVVTALALLAALLHPRDEDVVSIDRAVADELAAYEPPDRPASPTPAQRVDHSPLINLALGAAGIAWLVLRFTREGFTLDLDRVNFIFLIAAVLLHWRPASLTRAAREGSAHLHGIVLQFPLYAGMFGIIKGTKLASKLTAAFVSLSSRRTFPLVTFWYSGLLNYFVPSGGSKWAIEAPYLLRAGAKLGVPVEKTAMAYAYGDMSTNLIQPFWAIPLLSVAKLEFKDILGYEVLAFLLYSIISSVALAFFY